VSRRLESRVSRANKRRALALRGWGDVPFLARTWGRKRSLFNAIRSLRIGRKYGEGWLRVVVKDAPLQRGRVASGDRGVARSRGHAHDRATLCPPRSLARRPGDPRHNAQARARGVVHVVPVPSGAASRGTA
jgi:hypothetical protein